MTALPARFAPAGGYFRDRTHFTRVVMSSSCTLGVGSIGIRPQTPTPPFLTFSIEACAWAPLSATVLGGDVLVGRADELLVDRVAGGAGVFRGERELVGDGERGGNEGGREGREDQAVQFQRDVSWAGLGRSRGAELRANLRFAHQLRRMRWAAGR